MDPDLLIQFKECFILRDRKIVKEDLWLQNGKIIDPEPIFFDEKKVADLEYNCGGRIISPGFIDVQINGAYGINFSDLNLKNNPLSQIKYVGRQLVKDGVTSFVPTIITSPTEYYHKVLPKLKKSLNETDCANILGLHLEGPFINPEKKGIHEINYIKCYDKDGYQALKDVYGADFDDPNGSNSIITLAPEYHNSSAIIQTLASKGIRVSLGHSMANLDQGMEAVKNGATFITHLFNAMLPFHHRDPGLVGLLACSPSMPTIYFGMITDGIHTNPAAIRIAQRVHPKGLVIVTDAILTMGLPEDSLNGDIQKRFLDQSLDSVFSPKCSSSEHFTFGGHDLVSTGKTAMTREHTIAGGMTTFDACVQFFHDSTGCSIVEALESGTRHAAQMLGLEKQKGTLDFGSDADLIVLDPNTLTVEATFLSGHLAWQNKREGLEGPLKITQT